MVEQCLAVRKRLSDCKLSSISVFLWNNGAEDNQVCQYLILDIIFINDIAFETMSFGCFLFTFIIIE